MMWWGSFPRMIRKETPTLLIIKNVGVSFFSEEVENFVYNLALFCCVCICICPYLYKVLQNVLLTWRWSQFVCRRKEGTTLSDVRLTHAGILHRLETSLLFLDFILLLLWNFMSDASWFSPSAAGSRNVLFHFFFCSSLLIYYDISVFPLSVSVLSAFISSPRPLICSQCCRDCVFMTDTLACVSESVLH